jgi:hypothetical protein
VGVKVGEVVIVSVPVMVTVNVFVTVLVNVGDGVFVKVGVFVRVNVGVAVIVGVTVNVGVLVGVAGVTHTVAMFEQDGGAFSSESMQAMFVSIVPPEQMSAFTQYFTMGACTSSSQPGKFQVTIPPLYEHVEPAGPVQPW